MPNDAGRPPPLMRERCVRGIRRMLQHRTMRDRHRRRDTADQMQRIATNEQVWIFNALADPAILIDSADGQRSICSATAGLRLAD